MNIDNLLRECEPLVEKYTEFTPKHMLGEVQQEMMIRLWRLIENKYDGSVPIQEFITDIIHSIYRSSYDEIIRFNRRRSGRFININKIPDGDQQWTPAQFTAARSGTSIAYKLSYDSKILEQLSDTSLDTLEKLMKCLDSDEKFIIRYIIATCNYGNNYDSLMRQFGYTGKGATKYILNNIFAKIRNYAKEKNIEIKF